VLSVVHDMADFLPWYDQSGNLVEMTEIRKRQAGEYHPLIMWQMVRWFGVRFGIEEAEQVAKDIVYHDLFMSKPSSKAVQRAAGRMSNAGMLVADADRLVEDVDGSIHRNRIGSLGRWYILNPELSNEHRYQWRMRTGGLYDGLSALLTEFCGSEAWMFTEAGKGAFLERQGKFKRRLVDYYVQEFDFGWQALANAWGVGVGLKGQKMTLHPERATEFRDFTALGIDRRRQSLKHLVAQPVREKSRLGRDYYGYSLLVERDDGTRIWLDPSVLIYEDREELAVVMGEVIDNFISGLGLEGELGNRK
jgi:hypothetical protein